MIVRDSFAGMAAFLTVLLGFTSSVQALSFDEFDRLPDYQQENFIFTVLNYYHYQFSQNDGTSGIANCMVDLDERPGAGGNPYLFSIVLRNLNGARASIDNGSTVEGVIRDVIDRECSGR